MTYCFDIDGTLCTNTEGNYRAAEPFSEIIDQVNKLHAEGHHILLYTARGSTTGIDWRDATKGQLNRWNVHYHQLVMGKPTADVYIDDKALNLHDWKSRGFSVPAPVAARPKER